MKTLQELETEVQAWRDKQKKCIKGSEAYGYCQGWIHSLEGQIKDRCIYIGEVESSIGWSREAYLHAHGCV